MVGTCCDSMREARAHAMGTDVHLIVVGGDERLLGVGLDRIRELEGRWSRFIDVSEVSFLNRHTGKPVIVSPDTMTLVERSIVASVATEGRFDPTVGAAMLAHGYDRDFAQVRATIVVACIDARPAPGVAHIGIDHVLNAITLPHGVTFDPGGIGKGLAADLTAQALLDAGASGALVNIGGDLRAMGTPPTPDGWPITVPDPHHPERELLRVMLPHGAVATSTRLERTWCTTTGAVHHIIDPATGRPAATDVVAVTVVAADASWAEARTKDLMLIGPIGLDGLRDAHAVIVTADGDRHATPGVEGALR